MPKEYNYDLASGAMISVSMQGTPLVVVGGQAIIYNKRSPSGAFVERYVVTGPDSFASVDQAYNPTNSYRREEGAFQYGCNVKYTRDDGREYFAQNPIVAPELFPQAEAVAALLAKHPGALEVIYVEKTAGNQIYVIVSEE